MPKRSTRHVREPGNTRSAQQQPPHGSCVALPGAAAAATATATTATTTITTATAIATVVPEATAAKHFRSVHIGVTNGKRWLSLKKRLGLTTDEDVAVYLLDLAESTASTRYISWRHQRHRRDFVSLTTTSTDALRRLSISRVGITSCMYLERMNDRS